MTEEQLWRQLKAGQKSALEQLYRSHAEALLLYGHKFSADTQLVEDAVQDLFVELWQNREKAAQASSVRAYLLVALRRRIIRRMERQLRRESTEEAGENLFEVEISIDEQIAARELSAERRDQLNHALRELSNRQKEALYLKYQLNLNYEDICAVMDINYQSARNLVASALKRLKELMAGSWWPLFFIFSAFK